VGTSASFRRSRRFEPDRATINKRHLFLNFLFEYMRLECSFLKLVASRDFFTCLVLVVCENGGLHCLAR
jgi:hypothetical protein